jgi:hypothetical protein
LATFHESCADKVGNIPRIEENIECLAVVEDRQNEDHTEETRLDCEKPDGSMITVSGIEESWIKEKVKNGELHSATDSIVMPSGSKEHDGKLIIPPGGNIEIHRGSRLRRLAGVTGVKTVLVARIVAPDRSTTSSEAVISNKVFGTSGDEVNLRSQYWACSHGQLEFKPAEGADITNGVTTVNIGINVNGNTDGIIRNAATTALATKFGVSSASQIADYVMLCIPPGTSGSWIAYAYINSWLSVYNNGWCNYPSGQMHEIGHNLNLAHSGESASYDDQSGMMGYSYSNDEGPVMCFNGPKNWQLGWFDDKRTAITPTEGVEASFTLIGAAEYTQASGNEYVILKVGTKHYISFNRRVGVNSGTVEGGDKVLVHEKEGTGYGQSTLLSKLSSGGSYSIGYYNGSEKSLEITVASIGARAQVKLCLGGNCAVVPPTSPTSPPTPPPCNGKTIEISVKPDNYPGETTWKLVNQCTTNEVVAGGPYSDSNLATITRCLPDAKYKFEIEDTYGDGICCNYGNGYYRGVLDGVEVFSGGEFTISKSHEFGSCEQSPPPPTSPPTKAPTPAPSKAPTKAPTPAPTSPPTIAATPQPSSTPSKSPTPVPTSELTQPADLIFENDFESPNDLGDFFIGGVDATRYTGSNVHSGEASIMLRNGDGKDSAMVSDPIDVSGYDELKVKFHFLTQEFESNDGFVLEYAADGGSDFIVGEQWLQADDFTNGDWNEVTNSIFVDANVSTIRIRIRMSTTGITDNDIIYIDDVKVSGVTLATLA